MGQKQKRIKNRALLDEIREKPCVACGKSGPNDPHHIRTVKSGGDDIYENVLSLCRRCHHEIHSIGLNLFAKRNTGVINALLSRGWRYEDFIGKWQRDLDSSS